jgi:galactokinase
MMGGGFGGCTISLVKENSIQGLLSSIVPAYEKAMELPLTYYIASIENGTSMVV